MRCSRRRSSLPERKIPVQYAKKMQGRKMFGGQSSHIPLKVNTAGVIPVIFASSMLQLPVVIAGFAGLQPASGEGASLIQKLIKVCDQSKWCNISSWGEFKYSLGLLVYIGLVIFFAYFYTSVTFNPLEILYGYVAHHYRRRRDRDVEAVGVPAVSPQLQRIFGRIGKNGRRCRWNFCTGPFLRV